MFQLKINAENLIEQLEKKMGNEAYCITPEDVIKQEEKKEENLKKFEEHIY